MIHSYPELAEDEVARAGEHWLFCDSDSCKAAVKVEGAAPYQIRDRTLYEAPMPEGWGTSDPDDNALAGAAQFCPKHVKLLGTPVPEASAPGPVEA
jgi:hypothetical protein